MINNMNSSNKDALTYFFSKYSKDMNTTNELDSVLASLNAYEKSDTDLFDALNIMKDKSNEGRVLVLDPLDGQS